MTDLREKVAKAIYNAPDPLSGDSICTVIHMSEHLHWDSNISRATDIERQLAAVRIICQSAADAAIKTVLDALKEPSEAMVEAGEKAAWDDNSHMPMHRALEHGYVAMIQAFTRDHYLSALAEEDGKLTE